MDASIWLVQNPRSNRGNRVGYPTALQVSNRVALGTDGYPSAMSDEVAALRKESAANGDDVGRVRARPAAGARLLAERFGFGGSPPDEAARARGAAALDDIRQRAQVEADALWDRMRRL